MTTNKQWYRKSGPEGDVVISTRIRLARNLRGYPFPASMDDEQKARLVDTITAAAKTAAGTVDGIGTLTGHANGKSAAAAGDEFSGTSPDQPGICPQRQGAAPCCCRRTKR